jgi:HEAT repeat protein
VVDPLIDALRSPSAKVRAAAAEALSYQRDPRAGPALVDALFDPDKDTAHQASLALYAIRDPALVEPLLARALFTRDATVRRRIIQALGQIGDARAVEPLLALEQDPIIGMDRVTIDALRRITGQNLGGQRDAWLKWWGANKRYYLPAAAGVFDDGR